jgi:hypothetical protein
MKRAALEKVRTVQVWRQHLAVHAAPIVCACELQVGRFRKGQRIGGCGKPRCFLCHAAKLSRIPKVRERRASATLREGLAETRPNPSLNRTPAGGLSPARWSPVSLLR